MRHRNFWTTLCGLGLLGSPAISHAQEGDGWTVVEQPTACAMWSQQPDGTKMAFSVPKSPEGSVSLLLGNSAWRSLAKKERVRLSIYLNGRPRLLKPVPVQVRDGAYWVSIPISRDFAAQLFKQSITVAVEYQGNMIAILPSLAWVEGTYTATERCAGFTSDPFAN